MNTMPHTLWSLSREQGFTYAPKGLSQVYAVVPMSHGDFAAVMHGLEHLSDHSIRQRYQDGNRMIVILDKASQGVPYGN